jgi:hypothetical protein
MAMNAGAAFVYSLRVMDAVSALSTPKPQEPAKAPVTLSGKSGLSI